MDMKKPVNEYELKVKLEAYDIAIAVAVLLSVSLAYEPEVDKDPLCRIQRRCEI